MISVRAKIFIEALVIISKQSPKCLSVEEWAHYYL